MRPASSISADSRCSGCGGITDALSKEDIAQYEGLVPDWSFTDDYTKMERRIRLKNFTAALELFNRIGEVAEAEGHHPDLSVFDYNKVIIGLSTHKVRGITENDIIMAVKIDALPIILSKRPF